MLVLNLEENRGNTMLSNKLAIILSQMETLFLIEMSLFFFFFLQVKRNVYDLTSIPVRHQLWEGWPTSATDDSVSDVDLPVLYPRFSFATFSLIDCDNKQNQTLNIPLKKFINQIM